MSKIKSFCRIKLFDISSGWGIDLCRRPSKTSPSLEVSVDDSRISRLQAWRVCQDIFALPQVKEDMEKDAVTAFERNKPHLGDLIGDKAVLPNKILEKNFPDYDGKTLLHANGMFLKF